MKLILAWVFKIGSGKRIPLDAFLPFAFVPAFCLLCAMSYHLAMGLLLTVGSFMFYMRVSLPVIAPRSQFFSMWLIASIVFILLVFHTTVISKLEILPEEHLALVLLIVISVVLLFEVRRKARGTYRPFYVSLEEGVPKLGSSMEVKPNNPENTFCNLCIGEIRCKMFHSLWLDCCITKTSFTTFTCGSIFSVMSLFYGANLILTSICHPFIAFGVMLLPGNCDNVYLHFDFATCFVCGVYAVIMAVLLTLFILKTLLCKCFSLICNT